MHFLFLLKRMGYGLLVLILVVLLITSIIYMAPVDPARLTFGQRSDNATVEAKRKELKLDRPLYIQLAFYLKDLSPIDIVNNDSTTLQKYDGWSLIKGKSSNLILKWPYLRESFQTGRKVSQMLRDAIPQTAFLALAAMFIAILLGIPLGILAALKQHTWFDNIASIIAVLGYSLPSYIVAMFTALLFGYALSDYTGFNVQGSLFEINDLGEDQINWSNLVLPAVALGIRPVALIMQLTRSAMLDVLTMDYIRTAKAKGLTRLRILFRHALRNALTPVVTALSGWFSGLLAGAFFVENVFGYNGLGQVAVTALLNYDIPVVLGAVLFTAIVFIIMNIIVDLLYGVLDPRVSIQ